MKTLIKTALIATGLGLLATMDVSVVDGPDGKAISLQVMSEAHAVAGRQRRTRRRGLAVGYSAGKASGAAAATAAATSAPAQAPAAAPAPAPTPAPVPVSTAPAIGSIVTALPGGCAAITISGVQYNNCGGVYYRAAFQGSSLVYVVTQP